MRTLGAPAILFLASRWISKGRYILAGYIPPTWFPSGFVVTPHPSLLLPFAQPHLVFPNPLTSLFPPPMSCQWVDIQPPHWSLCTTVVRSCHPPGRLQYLHKASKPSSCWGKRFPEVSWKAVETATMLTGGQLSTSPLL